MPPPIRAARRPRHRLLTRLLASLLVATGLVALPASAPPSGASSRYLCTGYTACANAGYSHAGYGSRSGTMYWRMYAGHNCTNYVAYRMIQKGMSPERPWSGTGMAYNWGFAMGDITDDRPTVGAVAWWNRGVSGAGSSGHVAYVEKVVSPTEIVISEDSWSGDFHWRTIYKDGSGWPTGFIHFVDQQTLTPTAVPKVYGTPEVGTPLQGVRAAFEPAVSTHSLQWLANGVAVPGATEQTFTPTADTVGKVITLRDTGTRADHVDGVATSAPTAPVAAGAIARVAKPTLSGSTEVGQVLTATPGEWAPTPDSVAYRWRVDGVRQRGFTGPTFTLTRDLVGTRISVVAVARSRGYARVANASTAVGPVVAGVIELTEPFRASGAATHGSELTFAAGAWTPAAATAGYEWFRDGVAVPGATGSTYALGDGDVGRRLTVRATVSRDHYQGLARSADYGVVTTPSTIALSAGGRKRGAVARVRITAPGAPSPTGTIWARVRESVVRGTVVDGVAELRLSDLTPGRRTLVVLYAGDGVAVERSIVTTPIVVKR